MGSVGFPSSLFYHKLEQCLLGMRTLPTVHLSSSTSNTFEPISVMAIHITCSKPTAFHQGILNFTCCSILHECNSNHRFLTDSYASGSQRSRTMLEEAFRKRMSSVTYPEREGNEWQLVHAILWLEPIDELRQCQRLRRHNVPVADTNSSQAILDVQGWHPIAPESPEWQYTPHKWRASVASHCTLCNHDRFVSAAPGTPMEAQNSARAGVYDCLTLKQHAPSPHSLSTCTSGIAALLRDAKRGSRDRICK